MIRVAIETSTPAGSVAVGRGGEVLAESSLGVQRRHAEQALPTLERLLTEAGIEREAIEGVVVGAGPGSFTGVRVAGATAKGLVAALGVPLLAYPSLLALAVAASRPGDDRPICALFDARRGEVFAGCWTVAGAAIEEHISPMVAPLPRVLDRASAFSPIYAALNPDRLGMARRDDVREATPTARALLELAGRDPELGRVDRPGEWEPAYVRASSAERGVAG